MHIPSVRKLPLVLAISLASASAWADDSVSNVGTTEVWATQVSSSSTYLGDDDIDLKQADHLSDLLRSLPGVEVGGTHSMVQKISVRSLDDTDLDITIDGASQNAFMFHHAGNLLINPDILKAADVQVGTNSVLSGGLGGSVSFETKDAADLLQSGKKFGGRVQSTVASNKYAGYSLTGYGQLTDNLDLLAYIDQVDRKNPEDGKGRESLGNDGEIMNTMLKLGIDLDVENRIELAYDHYEDEGDYPPRADMGVATNKSISGDVLYPTTFERTTLTAVHELDRGDSLYVRSNLYANELILDRGKASDGSSEPRSGTVDSVGGKVLAESRLASGSVMQTLRYGGEVHQQEIKAKVAGVVEGSEESSSSAIYIEDEIALTDSLRVTPGLRYNRYDIDAAVADKTYNEMTWGLGSEVDVTGNLTLRAAVTSLFQGPNLEEAFLADDSATSNADLKAETGLNREVGLRFNQSRIAGLDQLRVGVNVFRTEIDDRITYESGAGWVNKDEVTLNGFEVSVKADKGNLGVLFSYSHTDSEDKATDEPLTDESGDSLSLALSYMMPMYDLELAWESQVVMDENHYDKPGYDVHDVSARWTPSAVKGLALTAGIENLLDTYYVSHVSRIGESNHPRFGELVLDDSEPGRNIKLTAAYSF